MRDRYKYGLIIGIISLAIGILLSVLNVSVDRIVVISVINLGLVLIVFSIILHIVNKDYPVADERTRKISATAVERSWFITMLVICLLIWVEYFNVIQLSVMQTLMVILLVMSGLNLLFKVYYERKGDIE
jgi:uncharacterized membrane protein